MQAALQLAGGVFLLWLAAGALRSFRRGPAPANAGETAGRRSLLKGVLVNFLNPNPWLGWTLVLGPLLLKGWRESPARGVALVAGFYGTIVAGMAGIVALSAGARRLGPRVARALVGISALALAAFAAYELWSGASALLAG